MKKEKGRQGKIRNNRELHFFPLFIFNYKNDDRFKISVKSSITREDEFYK